MKDRNRCEEELLSEINELRGEVSALKESRRILEETRKIARLGGWELDLRTDQMVWTREVYDLAQVSADCKPDLEKTLACHIPQHAAVLKKALRQAAEFGTPFDLELRVVTPKGNDLWVRVMAEAVEKDGKPVKLAGIVQDITDRKRAEEALRKARDQLEERVVERTAELERSKEKVEALLNATTESIFLLDSQGAFLALNENIAERLGQPPEQLLGKSPFSLISADAGKRRRKRFAEVLRTGRAVRFVDERHGKLTDQNFYPVMGEDGAVKAVAVFARDITEQKHAEDAVRKGRDELEERVKGRTAELRKANEQLRREIAERKRAQRAQAESEERYRAIFENAQDSIYIKNIDSEYIHFNPSFIRLLGVPAAELIGKTDKEIFGQKEASRTREVDLRVLSGQVVIEEQPKIIKGRKTTFHAIKVPIRDSSGEVTGICGIARDLSDRMRAEEALRNSERMLSNILSASPIGIGYVEESTLKWSNQAMAAMFGHDLQDEYLGRNIRDFYASEEEFESVRRKFASLLQQGQPAETVARLRRKDGSVYYGHVKTSALYPSDPKKATITTISDISAKMQAEQALRESEERYRLLTENSLTGVFIHQDELYVYVNERFAEIFGYRPDEMIGMPFRKVLHPDDLARIEEETGARSHGANITPQHYECRVFHRDGSTKWLEVLASSIPYQGRTAAMGNVYDITDRKSSEAALMENEEKYRTIVENIEEGYYEVDKTGTMEFCNDAVCRMLGYARHELIGMNYTQYMDQANATAAFRTFNAVYRTGKPTKIFEWELIRKDGARTSVEASVSPIRDAGGAVVGFRGICRDVEERKRAEQEFLKAQKLESLELVAGGIAHDFNNLLTGNIANISLARLLAKTDSEVLDALTNAEIAAERAKDLTRQLLTFAKGGSPVIRSTSLAELLRESAGLVLSGSNLKSEFHIAEDLRPAQVDQLQISQVAQNVLINAQQAMPDGGTITVRAENVAVTPDETERLVGLREGDYVRLSFEDDGPGIAPENLPRIFDPYFTTKPKGTGLGLSTAHSIIKRHAGHMEVASRLGEGTTFTVYLPASEQRVESPDRPGESPARGAGRILLMDDEPMIRQVAGELLELLGYDVACTSDGQEAVDRYQKAMESGTPFDAVIMDLTVPGGMGGKGALERLLEIDPEVSAIVSSGYSTDSVMSRYAEFGFKGVVEKPYNATDLSRVLHDVLSEQAG
jgi:PAS domain S-box-containing protein